MIKVQEIWPVYILLQAAQYPLGRALLLIEMTPVPATMPTALISQDALSGSLLRTASVLSSIEMAVATLPWSVILHQVVEVSLYTFGQLPQATTHQLLYSIHPYHIFPHLQIHLLQRILRKALNGPTQLHTFLILIPARWRITLEDTISSLIQLYVAIGPVKHFPMSVDVPRISPAKTTSEVRLQIAIFIEVCLRLISLSPLDRKPIGLQRCSL